MPPKELLTLWTRDDMPVEMAVGHILQNLAKLQTSVEANHLKIRQLQTTLFPNINASDFSDSCLLK